MRDERDGGTREATREPSQQERREHADHGVRCEADRCRSAEPNHAAEGVPGDDELLRRFHNVEQRNLYGEHVRQQREQRGRPQTLVYARAQERPPDAQRDVHRDECDACAQGRKHVPVAMVGERTSAERTAVRGELDQRVGNRRRNQRCRDAEPDADRP